MMVVSVQIGLNASGVSCYHHGACEMIKNAKAKIKMKNDTRRSFKREMRDERRGDRMKLARPD
eukprot:scaffold43737_cov204-Skeletonema_marinoi.AAC.10